MTRMFFVSAAIVLAASLASVQGVDTKPTHATRKVALPPDANSQPNRAPASDSTASDTAAPPPAILRESFAYDADDRRDPFVSLLTTNELRPTMTDLRLTGILYDQSGGRRSVATLRDLSTNQQYRVNVGSALGRMRVAAIGVKRILFTIHEFGATRQDSLVLGDSSKARAK